MTPQLMQAIKLLQLSSLDLTAYVEAELEKNPLLERADAEPSNDVPEIEAQASDREFADGEPDSSDWMGESLDVSRDSIEQRLDTSLENVFPSELPDQPARASTNELPAVSEWASVGSGGREGDDFGLESFAAAEISLRDHLSEQMALALTSPADRLIGAHLIDMVDEAGYISGELDPIAEKLGAETAHVERVLSVLQTLDPAGVCARNLAECLELQLKDRNRFDPAMAVLIANLELIAKRDYVQLRKLCGVDDEDIAEMVGEIRQLNPKPGLAFGSTLVQPVIPDVLVRPAQDGSWQVELNNDTLPKVLLNQSYFAQVSKGVLKPGEKAYLSECMQNGTWLVRALDQRARTILKVATEIVRQQDGFFALGVQHLRPLSLRVIADAIGMHESTVSRVTANKYMATTRGIFELKYFFTSSIASADGGDAHSAEAVRFRIKNLIDGEGVSDILSDDTIVTRLRDAGIDIARRTVAKYREAMRIPSSVQRRRDKQALGRTA